jgi:glycosyltransferase involved in cell wall biosynthesis
VSPYLLSQLPGSIPKLLLRGVVGEDVLRAEQASRGVKKNWVAFAGTHIESNGVAGLIEAWKRLDIPGWELHVTGQGHLTPSLQAAAVGAPTIVFHGLVDRPELVSILSSARICINPHRVGDVPGAVFAFKIIEYLAAGAHVITTPMGELETGLEQGITYLVDNSPESIVSTLTKVVRQELYHCTAARAAARTYGMQAASESLGRFVVESVSHFKTRALRNAM